MTWKPSGSIVDVAIEIAPIKDPEASLFRYERWILAKTALAVENHTGWDQKTLAVICLEALGAHGGEHPRGIEWRTAAGAVLYVRRADVTDIEEGLVTPADRFRLYDAARRFEMDPTRL